MSVEDLYAIFRAHRLVCTDTRNIANDCIFFALKGATFNGNAFAEEALKKGAAYVVIDEEQYKKDDKYILVDDVLKSLQLLANHHRHQLKCPVLAITGTNGKTTTKELVSKVLAEKFITYSTAGNFNNHIGVPLTILSAPDQAEMLVVEMGANHIGEIEMLCSIAEPDLGIITNVGKAHLEGFGSYEGVKKAKGELYEFLTSHDGIAFVNGDNSELAGMLSENKRQVKNIVEYGSSGQFLCNGNIVESFPFLNINWKYSDVKGELTTHLIGEYNFENILAAVCIGNHFGVFPHQIKKAIEAYIPGNNRSQIITKGDNTIILDAYNANPTSMTAALKNLAAMDSKGKEKIVLLGEMAELGHESAKEHRVLAELISTLHFQKVFLVGKHFMQPDIEKDFMCFESTDEAIAYVKLLPPFTNSIILIKGSRSAGMEKMLNVI